MSHLSIHASRSDGCLHTQPQDPLALLPTPHTSCLFHHLYWQLRLPILTVTAIGTAIPGREGEGLWGFQMGSGKGHSQSAPSHVRPSLATSGSRDLARSHSARHESWGSDGGGSESPSLKALLHQNGLDSRGCSSGTEWPSARQLRGAKVNSAALGRGWGGARTHQPRTSASW